MLRSLAATSALAVLVALPCVASAMNGPTGGTELPGARPMGPVNYLRDAKYTPALTVATHTVAQGARRRRPRVDPLARSNGVETRAVRVSMGPPGFEPGTKGL
jgi:hypothetical protein